MSSSDTTLSTAAVRDEAPAAVESSPLPTREADVPGRSESQDQLTGPLVKLLERSGEPLTANQIRQQLPGSKRKPEELQSALQELVSRGQIHQLPKYRGSERYSVQDLETYARGCIVELLSESAKTRSELQSRLNTRLQGMPESRKQQLIRELLASGEIRELPPYLGARTKRLSAREADPRDYLRQAIDKVQATLTKAGVSRTAIAQAAQQMLQHFEESDFEESRSEESQFEEAPFEESKEPAARDASAEPEDPLTTTRPATEAPTTLASEDRLSKAERLPELESLIFARMNEIEPQAAQGAMVPIMELREAMEFQAEPGEFDHLIWSLVERGTVAVHQLGYTGDLTTLERAQLLSDDLGRVYNGISRRVS